MNVSDVFPTRAPRSSHSALFDLRSRGLKAVQKRREAMFLKSKRKKRREDLNHRVCKYQRWWQDRGGDSSSSGSFRSDEKPRESGLEAGEAQKVPDESFVYYEGN